MHLVHSTPEQLGELQFMRFRHPCPAVQRRAEMVLLASRYIAYGKIAEALGISPNTVTNTIVMFNSGGIERLTKWRAGDADGEMSTFDALVHDAWEKHPPATAKDAAAQLEIVTGVRRSLTAVRECLKRLGFKRRKAGSVPGKADPEKQRLFIQEAIEPSMAASRDGLHAVYFMDAAHFVFGAFLGYVWCLARMFIPTAPGRQRYNLLGAVDVIGGSLLTVSNTAYINASTVCEMLIKMAEANIGRTATVFLDNAR